MIGEKGKTLKMDDTVRINSQLFSAFCVSFNKNYVSGIVWLEYGPQAHKSATQLSNFRQVTYLL